MLSSVTSSSSAPVVTWVLSSPVSSNMYFECILGRTATEGKPIDCDRGHITRALREQSGMNTDVPGVFSVSCGAGDARSHQSLKRFRAFALVLRHFASRPN